MLLYLFEKKNMYTGLVNQICFTFSMYIFWWMLGFHLLFYVCAITMIVCTKPPFFPIKYSYGLAALRVIVNIVNQCRCYWLAV